MTAALAKAACAAGNCAWGVPPSDAGDYNSQPGDSAFFSPWNGRDDAAVPSAAGAANQTLSQAHGRGRGGLDSLGNYASAYGKFFLGWYSDALLAHADAVLGAAREALGGGVKVQAKVAGIHW